MKYFDPKPDDKKHPERWLLDEPRDRNGEELEAREFRYGNVYRGPLPCKLPIYHKGYPVSFHLAAFDMPVVTTEIADRIQEIAPDEIERYPVIVEPDITGYEILNVICNKDCIDEERSYVMKWTEEDGRPEKVGKYRMIGDLMIDPSRTDGKHIFRIEAYRVVMIVSEVIKEAIQDIENLGIVFKQVTP